MDLVREVFSKAPEGWRGIDAPGRDATIETNSRRNVNVSASDPTSEARVSTESITILKAPAGAVHRSNELNI